MERKKIVVNDFDMEGIWHTVHNFYREKKYPTLESLLVVVKEKGLFVGKRITLWKLLRKLLVSGISKLMISSMCMSSPV